MADNASSAQDLTVRGELIERAYGNYIENRYLVNRRYQRKLVWTLSEKVAFIDSILHGYPVPIILLAENKARGRNVFEIIDGMQRLNAVLSFIDNDYPVDSTFFDLNTMAITKALLDDGKLEQRQPAMARDKCVQVASYLLPLSIYESADVSSIDTVFRRINSGTEAVQAGAACGWLYWSFRGCGACCAITFCGCGSLCKTTLRRLTSSS